MRVDIGNRLQIVNWRRHGEPESYIKVAAFAADDDTDLMREIEQQVDPGYDWERTLEVDPEEEGDWKHVIYVSDDRVISNGEIVSHKGRKFRVTIEELK